MLGQAVCSLLETSFLIWLYIAVEQFIVHPFHHFLNTWGLLSRIQVTSHDDIFLRIISASYVTDPISCHRILDPMVTPSLVLPPVNGPWLLQIHEAKHFPPVEVTVDVEMFE